jgi:hypothetical protein
VGYYAMMFLLMATLIVGKISEGECYGIIKIAYNLSFDGIIKTKYFTLMLEIKARGLL